MDDIEVRAKDAVVDALQDMAFHEANGEGLSYGSAWQLVGEADTLVTYKQPDPSNSSITIARTFGRVRAEIDDVMGFYYSETSADFLKVSQLLHQEIHDVRVLSVRRTRCTTHPHSFLGLKYACVQSVSAIPPRDQVFAEYMGFAQDAKGRAVGFHATVPLHAREVPELGATLRVPRVRITNVLLVRPLDNQSGQCAVFTNGSYDMRESSSNMNAYLRKNMENLRDIAVLMDSKRISSEQLMSKHSWVPDSLRKSCNVCTRSFGPTRHRHHCRLCGEVVCKKCLVSRSVMAKPVDGGRSGSGGMTKLKVCTFCVQKTRSKSVVDAKSSFGLPSVSEHEHGRKHSSSSPMNHTITSSMDRQSFVSDVGSDASSAYSAYSFDIGFEIRSPSRRYSDMSVASTIFEREDHSSIPESFAADLYIDTAEMVPAQRSQQHPPRSYSSASASSQQHPPRSYSSVSASSHSSPYSPQSSRSSSSGGSGASGDLRNYPHRHHHQHQHHHEHHSRANLPPPAPQSGSHYSDKYAANPSSNHGLLRRQSSARSQSSQSSDHGISDGYKFNRIDQQLAEQQEILRRLAIASTNYNTRTSMETRRAHN